MTDTDKLKVTIIQGRNLASSRRIYCECTCVDSMGKVIGAPLKTAVSINTNKPFWNHTITFDIPKGFDGIAIRAYEHHKWFSDKFLGMLLLKFNMERLLQGKDRVDSWFSLANNKKPGGEIEIKVESTRHIELENKKKKRKPHFVCIVECR